MKNPQYLRKRFILEGLGLKKKSTLAASFARTCGVLAMGLATGLGLGLLLAPRPGRQIRDDLSRRIKRSAGRAANRAHDWLESTQMAGA
jgi:hypothetical protein